MESSPKLSRKSPSPIISPNLNYTFTNSTSNSNLNGEARYLPNNSGWINNYWSQQFQSYLRSIAYSAMLYNPSNAASIFATYNVSPINSSADHYNFPSLVSLPSLLQQQRSMFSSRSMNGGQLLPTNTRSLQEVAHSSSLSCPLLPQTTNIPNNTLKSSLPDYNQLHEPYSSSSVSTNNSLTTFGENTTHVEKSNFKFELKEPPKGKSRGSTLISSRRNSEVAEKVKEFSGVTNHKIIPKVSKNKVRDCDLLKKSTRGFKPYTCTICLASYHHKFELNRHVKVSHVRPHRCEQCGKGFGHRNYLRMHIETVHLGRKSYECKFCGKFLSTGGNLNVHVRTIHFGEKKYNCPICNRSFGQQCNMKTHMRRHAHKDQPI